MESSVTDSCQPSTPAIAIVGGGLGGVILAIGLLQQRIPFHIYEAAADFGEIGAGVTFGPNSVRSLGLVSPALLEACNKHLTSNETEDQAATFLTFRHLRTTEKANAGDWISDLRGGPLARGEEGPPTRCCVHRAAFLDEIVKLLPPGSASFGKRLVTLEEPADDGDGDIILHFADGTTASAAAVVGCDGIKSATRRHLHGAEAVPVYAQEWCYRCLVPRDDLIAAVGHERATNGQLYVGAGGYLLHYPVSNGKMINMLAICGKADSTWPYNDWVVPCEEEDMQADVCDWEPKLISLYREHALRSPDGKLLKWAIFDNLHPNPYSRGRICLLGDSAHATTPHLGAGAGMAIEDAYVMSRLLEPGCEVEDIRKAFALYDALRRPRTQELIRKARLSGRTYAFLDPSVGDDLEKMHAEFSKRYNWVWDEDMEAAVRAVKDQPAVVSLGPTG